MPALDRAQAQAFVEQLRDLSVQAGVPVSQGLATNLPPTLRLACT